MNIFVTGTGTGVGKTHVTCELLRELHSRGQSVSVSKPVESFDPDEDTPLDSELLARAVGTDPANVGSRHIPLAMAPPRAAALLSMPPFSIAELRAEHHRLHGTADADEWHFIEGAGGIASPIAEGGDNRDLIDALAPELTIVVADAGLGTVNACTLVHSYLAHRPHVFFLNRYDASDPLHVDNAQIITRLAPAATSTHSFLQLDALTGR